MKSRSGKRLRKRASSAKQSENHYLKNLDDGGKSPCLVQVHVLKVDDLLDKYPERGQRTIEWVSCSEAATRVAEPELKGLFRLLEGRLAGNE